MSGGAARTGEEEKQLRTTWQETEEHQLSPNNCKNH